MAVIALLHYLAREIAIPVRVFYCVRVTWSRVQFSECVLGFQNLSLCFYLILTSEKQQLSLARLVIVRCA